MRDFRADKRQKLFDSINVGRRSIWAELTKLGYSSERALSFFRATGRRSRRAELTLAEAESALATAESALATAEASLKQAQAEPRAAQEREAQSQAVLSARQEARRALAAAEAEAQALARRIAQLRDQAT